MENESCYEEILREEFVMKTFWKETENDVTYKDFKEIYWEFGYDEALFIDENTCENISVYSSNV